CGKSTMLQCLVVMCATHHYGLSAADRDAKALLLTLRVLRNEFLQGLLHNATLQPAHVFFGGRLPDNVREAGVLGNDQEHLWNIMIC
ncbi:MAG: hypothetical protein ACKPKO_61155, partial [Candidatus Fonsibacter sp.]